MPDPTLPASGAIDTGLINVNYGVSGSSAFNLLDMMTEYSKNAIVYTGKNGGEPDSGLHDFYGAQYAECFVAGTKITMADGSKKNVEDVELGDIVMSYNPYSKVFEGKEILHTLNELHSGNPDDLTVRITWTDGTVNHCTDSNPFWVPGKDWCAYNPSKTIEKHGIRCNQLAVGDPCVKGDGTEVEVESIEVITEETLTYSLRVKQWATFIANGIVAHNKCFAGQTLITMADKTHKMIRELVTGDKILTGDGKIESIIILEQVHHDIMLCVTFDDDTELVVSHDHPIKVDNSGWHSFVPLYEFGPHRITTKPLLVGQVCSGKKIMSIVSGAVYDKTTYNIGKLTNEATTYLANDIVVRVE